MIIRKAISSDALGIAKVNVDTWRTAYKGILSDEYLMDLSYNQKEKRMRNVINNSAKNKCFTFIAEDNKNGIIGFASCGIEREGDSIYKGELYSLYILQDYQNNGVGKLLFNHVQEKLIEKNFYPMMNWVLEDNKQACQFYERRGCKKIKDRYINIGSELYKEVAYGIKKFRHINF